jgi:hypothetical protein
MSNGGASEIKRTVERLGRHVSQTGEAKRITYVESVDEEATVHRETIVEKNIFDCGHVGETGALCQVCGGFTVCEACAKSGKFTCSSCGRICCPHCSVESLFHPGVRFCQRCGWHGLLREALKGGRE